MSATTETPQQLAKMIQLLEEYPEIYPSAAKILTAWVTGEGGVPVGPDPEDRQKAAAQYIDWFRDMIKHEKEKKARGKR